jgi:hypothetical protein
MDLHEVGLEGLNWTDLAEDIDRWQAPLSAETNLRVYTMRGISWLAEEVLASQEGICSMDLEILCALLTAPCTVHVPSLSNVKIFSSTFVLKRLNFVFFHLTVDTHFTAKPIGFIHTHLPDSEMTRSKDSHICKLHLEPLVHPTH